MDTVKIAVICGTSRDGRRSLAAAKWVAQIGERRTDVAITFVDPREFVMAGDGNNEQDKNTAFSKIVADSDAFYIVTPEYNHSFPGSLKRLLDSEFESYFHKPVATAGVSNGQWGGVRACEALLPVYHTMGMVVVKPELYFPKVQDLFTDEGALKPEHTDTYERAVTRAYDELVWFAHKLR